MPTVSAARGCSPTARVRRPQRVRNSSDLEDDDDDDQGDRERALAEDRVEDPADERQVGERIRRVPRLNCAGALGRA